MPTKYTCEFCGGGFQRNNAGNRKYRFCSPKCYHSWNRKYGTGNGRFQSGVVPWNKDTKGVMKPNSGSFVKGIIPVNKEGMGSVKIRVDKNGRERAWVKILDLGDSYDWKLRAVVVWEARNGPVPIGSVVHHKDRDTLNDKLSNLQVMTRAEHLKEHRHEYEARRRYSRKQNS